MISFLPLLILCGALLLVGGLLLIVGFVVMAVFFRRPAAQQEPPKRPRGAPTPTPSRRRADPPAPASTPAGAASAAASATPAPQPLRADDGPQPLESEYMPAGEDGKTEVFAAGSLNFDWDDEDEEGEATEIFRADVHGGGGFSVE